MLEETRTSGALALGDEPQRDGACLLLSLHSAAKRTPSVDTRALFARCRAAGLRVAVLSSDDRESVQAFLAQEEVVPDALHCGDDGRGHKPSAEPLLALAADLGVTPGSMIMVGAALTVVTRSSSPSSRTSPARPSRTPTSKAEKRAYALHHAGTITSSLRVAAGLSEHVVLDPPCAPY